MKAGRFILGALALYLGLQWQTGQLHWTRNPSSLSGNTCEGKRTCAVVYLAPWCPSCRSHLAQTQALLQRSRAGDAGVKVVVGMGRRPGENEEMARKIASTGVEIDQDTSFARRMEIRSVPAYIVVDKEGTRLVDGPEGFQWVMEKFGP